MKIVKKKSVYKTFWKNVREIKQNLEEIVRYTVVIRSKNGASFFPVSGFETRRSVEYPLNIYSTSGEIAIYPKRAKEYFSLNYFNKEEDGTGDNASWVVKGGQFTFCMDEVFTVEDLAKYLEDMEHVKGIKIELLDGDKKVKKCYFVEKNPKRIHKEIVMKFGEKHHFVNIIVCKEEDVPLKPNYL